MAKKKKEKAPDPSPPEGRRRERRLGPWLRRVRALVDRLDMEFDDALLDLESACPDEASAPAGASEGGGAAGCGSAERSRTSRKFSRAAERALRHLAVVGTSRLRVDWIPDAGAEVEVGDSEPFELPLKLALLLSVLASGKPEKPEDTLVPWKSLGEIALDIRMRSGDPEPVQPHAVTQLIGRLREAFFLNHINPFLVETRRGVGARMRYRPRTPL